MSSSFPIHASSPVVEAITLVDASSYTTPSFYPSALQQIAYAQPPSLPVGQTAIPYSFAGQSILHLNQRQSDSYAPHSTVQRYADRRVQEQAHPHSPPPAAQQTAPSHFQLQQHEDPPFSAHQYTSSSASLPPRHSSTPAAAAASSGQRSNLPPDAISQLCNHALLAYLHDASKNPSPPTRVDPAAFLATEWSNATIAEIECRIRQIDEQLDRIRNRQTELNRQ